MKNPLSLIAVLIVILIAVALYLTGREGTSDEPGNAVVETSGPEIAAPDTNAVSQTNPPVPDINAVSQSNPFSDIKVNPFE